MGVGTPCAHRCLYSQQVAGACHQSRLPAKLAMPHAAHASIMLAVRACTLACRNHSFFTSRGADKQAGR